MYKRVLVPVDGSIESEAILPFLLQIAGPLDMEIHLLRVAMPLPPTAIEASRDVYVDDPEARKAEALTTLAPLAAELTGKGIKCQTRARYGTPSTEILRAAREAGADLIAMTTHGRGGLGRLLFGSVAEAVLRESELPVFLMRQTPDQVKERAQGKTVTA